MPAWDVHFELRVDLTEPEVIRHVERAHALADVIRGIPIPPYLQLKLDTINIARTVRGTTAIEGANVTPEEVQQIIRSPNVQSLPEARRRDEQEVRNAQEVMLYLADLLGRRPDQQMTEDLICKIHELTTQHISYAHNTPGIYRTHGVSAGDYRPPAHGDDVKRLMREFVTWFHSPPAANWDPIIRALVGHFYVVSIHPFADGNGRTSRAIESFLLYQGHVNARGFYSIANYYYEHRSDYIWHLNNARFNSANDLTPFVLFGLKGLVSELQEIHQELLDEVKLIAFRDYAREMFLHSGRLGTKAGERVFHLLIALGRTPLPVASLSARTGPVASLYRRVSQRTLQRDIALLRDEGLIRLESGSIVPNLEIMDRFTALEMIRETQQRNRPNAT